MPIVRKCARSKKSEADSAIIGTIERLESRTVPAIFTVTTATDVVDAMDGFLSLREAIDQANGSAGADEIHFGITSGSGIQSIQLTSTLSTITEAVEIDGFKESGVDGVFQIELDGTSAGSSSIGLTIQSNAVVVRGLVINRFGGSGIRIDDSSHVAIEGNRIGTDAAGTDDLGNGGDGIHITASEDVTIGGTGTYDRNVISDNTGWGIRTESVYWDKVEDDYFFAVHILGNTIGLGTDDAALGNTAGGIKLDHSSGVIVGGDVAAARNIISGNGGDGVLITGDVLERDENGIIVSPSGDRLADDPLAYFFEKAQNLVKGNYIGTDSTGLIDRGNSGNGVRIADGAMFNIIGAHGQTEPASWDAEDIEAAADADAARHALQRNVISGNTLNGVHIEGTARYRVNEEGESGPYEGTITNVVAGNYIGVDASGQAALGNGNDGVLIDGAAAYNVIGTSGMGLNNAPGFRNIISGNVGYGVEINGDNEASSDPQTPLYRDSSGADTNQIAGNYIGVAATGGRGTGNADLGNANGGVRVAANALYNYVGTDPIWGGSFTRNIIADNGGAGVLIENANVQPMFDPVNVTVAYGPIDMNGVTGNWIGLAADGSALGNNGDGLRISNSRYVWIGGFLPDETRNIISGNLGDGVHLIDSGEIDFNFNWIGLDSTGLESIANTGDGIHIEGQLAPIESPQIINPLIRIGNTYGPVLVQFSAERLLETYYKYVFTIAQLETLFADSGLGSALTTAWSSINSLGELADEISTHLGTLTTGQVITALKGELVASLTPVLREGTMDDILVNLGFTDPLDRHILPSENDIEHMWAMIHRMLIENEFDDPTDLVGGNIVSGNDGWGIHIEDIYWDYSWYDEEEQIGPRAAVSIVGNYVGLDFGGSSEGNDEGGIRIDHSSGVIVGGDVTAARNIVSGNGGDGVLISGDAFVRNSEGLIDQEASDGRVGFEPGAYFFQFAQNLVKGNYIGTDSTGLLNRGNAGNGVRVADGAMYNIIGAHGQTTPASWDVEDMEAAAATDAARHALQRNVISGNTLNGVHIDGTARYRVDEDADGEAEFFGPFEGTILNVVAGNYIGVDASGEAALGNSNNGVLIDGAAAYTVIGTSGMGLRNAPGFRNVISGNLAYGVEINGDNTPSTYEQSRTYRDSSGTDTNQIAGNYIGVAASGGRGTGDADLGNVDGGVRIAGNALYNYVGTDPVWGGSYTRNIIADNGGAGVLIENANIQPIFDPVSATVVSGPIDMNGVTGNWIGLAADGSALGNNGDGLRISNSRYVWIGGFLPDETRNIISGNTGDGVHLINSGEIDFNFNWIGLDSTGLESIANTGDGIHIEGQLAPIETPRITNSLIRIGNTYGEEVLVSFATDRLLETYHKYVFTLAQLETLFADSGLGSALTTAWSSINSLGELANVISTELGTLSSEEVITALKGKLIDSLTPVLREDTMDDILVNLGFTDPLDRHILPGENDIEYMWALVHRMLVENEFDDPADFVGGNIVSGNDGWGIHIEDVSWDNTWLDPEEEIAARPAVVIVGNYIGLDFGGGSEGNDDGGVFIDNSSGIGIGYSTDSGNYISANGGDGIRIVGGTVNSTIEAGQFGVSINGNHIGTGALGEVGFGNNGDGVSVTNAVLTIVGGEDSESRNVIAGNEGYGIQVSGEDAFGTIISGNWIGADPIGADPQDPVLVLNGNSDGGILVDGAGSTIIGRTPGSDGLDLDDDPLTPAFQPFGNVIVDNGGAGIWFKDVGDSEEEVVIAASGNFIGVTPDEEAAGNAGDGILIESSLNVIVGGWEEDAGNEIAYNGTGSMTAANGIKFTGVSSDNRMIYRNFIHDNTGDGILVEDAGFTILGGFFTSLRNIITSNDGYGIHVSGEDSYATIITGNWIGVPPSGVNSMDPTADGNEAGGIRVDNDAGTTIIGRTPGADGLDLDEDPMTPADQPIGNFISGNHGPGVWLHSLAGNLGSDLIYSVSGNDIGITFDDEVAGNTGAGILIEDTSEAIIGGFIPEAGNRIIGNGTTLSSQNGITITGSASTDNMIFRNEIADNTLNGVYVDDVLSNRILMNSIYDNAVLGIDADLSVTLPVVNLLGATINSSNLLSVDFEITNTSFDGTIEFYIADANGQGKTFIGSRSYNSSQGTETFTYSGTDPDVEAGDLIVAVATNTNDTTFEFSVDELVLLI